MYKVGVWGPGSMGVIALRGVIDHPQLQLVDLVVHSDAKAGRDAGELCGIAPVGVRATKDPAATLAGDADVVVYAAAANLRPAEAIADMVSILRAGKNVVSCSVVPLVFPDAVDAASPNRCARPQSPVGCRSSPPGSTLDSPTMFCRWCLPGSRELSSPSG
jgi:2,4-diaminopentanoate dehydrogenase